MTNTLFCYHCRRHHPKEEMRQVHGKSASKWRCIKSIQETKRSVAQRDAFGRQVTADNSAQQREKAKALLNPELRLLRQQP